MDELLVEGLKLSFQEALVEEARKSLENWWNKEELPRLLLRAQQEFAKSVTIIQSHGPDGIELVLRVRK